MSRVILKRHSQKPQVSWQNVDVEIGEIETSKILQPMKSITLLTCGLIGALNLAGCSRKSSQAGPPAPEVLVIDAATWDAPVYREWIGTIDGSENADILARVTGHLIKRNYIEGSLVKKSDLLFEIDPRSFEAAVAQAKSELNEGKAAALAAASDRARADKLVAKKVISAQEHTNKTQLHEANAAKVQAC
jgi:multidrug efflux pump subunit AcrA (membrane-fusion protein)